MKKKIFVFTFVALCSCKNDGRGAVVAIPTPSASSPAVTAPAAPPPVTSLTRPDELVLSGRGAEHSADVTFYNPESNVPSEGGPQNLFDQPINSVEDAIRNGRPISISADSTGAFGEKCNQRHKRCTLLIRTNGFDELFPAYRHRFPNLPKDSLIGIVEDTGTAFIGTSGSKIDVPIRDPKLTDNVPETLHKNVRWIELENPCGKGPKSRNCFFAIASIAPETLAMLTDNELNSKKSKAKR